VSETIKSLIGVKIKVIKSRGLGIFILRAMPILSAVPISNRIEKTRMVLVSCCFLSFGIYSNAIMIEMIKMAIASTNPLSLLWLF
jgi:hypothetical protein